MIAFNHYYGMSAFDMTEKEKEIIEISTNLSPENQHTFLMYARMANAAESAPGGSVDRAPSGEDAVNAEQKVMYRQ